MHLAPSLVALGAGAVAFGLWGLGRLQKRVRREGRAPSPPSGPQPADEDPTEGDGAAGPPPERRGKRAGARRNRSHGGTL